MELIAFSFDEGPPLLHGVLFCPGKDSGEII
jgi:hypothetical protein